MRLPGAAWLLVLVWPAAAGGQVPVSDDPTAVFVMKVDGSGVRKVAQVEGLSDHASPRWSHDAERLVFDAALARRGNRKCFVVNVDGTGLGELCDGQLPDFSPDDQQVASQQDGAVGAVPEIYVQNLDGKGRSKIADGYSPRWSPDGGRLAFSDRQVLRVMDLLSGETVTAFSGPVGTLFNGFAWSPDGKRLAVATGAVQGPRELLIVDAEGNNPDLKPRLRNMLGGLISFSPDGKQIVFSTDFQLHVVDVEGNAAPRLVPGQEGQNRYPAWSPDGKWIAFTSTRKAPQPAPPKKADAQPGAKLEELRRYSKGSIVYSLGFTPDGRRVVMGGDPETTGVNVWDLASGESKTLGGQGIRIAMFPDGRRFATSWLSPTIQIVDLDSGEVLRELDHGETVRGLAVSKDGRLILSGGLDKVARVWDAETGRQLVAFAKHTHWITNVAISPDGTEALSTDHDKMLRVWDIRTGNQRLEIKHPDVVYGLAVTPDGRYILTGTGGSFDGAPTVLVIKPGGDNVMRIWDARSGTLVREMKGHTHAVYSIDVSPDGRLAASGGWDGTVRLWNLESGDELSRSPPGKGGVMRVVFSPDGKTVVAGGGVARTVEDIIEHPDEQIRVYKVVDAPGPTARSGKL